MDPSWVVAIATTIYVVLTGLICLSNFISSASAKRQTAELVRQREESQRPRIQVYVDFVRSSLCCLVIQNNGSCSAHNVKARINEDFLANLPEDRRSYIEQLNQSQLFLAPGQKFLLYITTSRNFDSVSSRPIRISIEYEDGKYSDTVEIDLSQYGFFILNPSTEERILEALREGSKKENKVLNKIAKAMERPTTNTIRCRMIQENDRELNKDAIRSCLARAGHATTIDLIEVTGISKEEVHSCLYELQSLDGLIKPMICTSSDGIGDQDIWCLK